MVKKDEKNKSVKKKGRVIVGEAGEENTREFVRTTKGVYPASVLEKSEIKKDSKQLKKEMQFGLASLISPPYNPLTFLEFSESCSIFRSCAEQIAEDVAGNGYTLELEEGQEENEETKAEYEKIKKFLKHVNPKETFREVFSKAVVDYCTIGWFGIEAVDSKDTNTKEIEISELYHLPAHTFRVHKDGEKYCQLRDNRRMWFKDITAEGEINEKSGKEMSDKESEDKANSLIFFKKYYAKSSFYGVPSIITALGSVIGLLGVRDYNLSFFENFGVPVALITLEGEWEEGSAKKIKTWLDEEVRGSNNAHKTMVFETPEGTQFTYKPLAVEQKEGSFRVYQQSLKDDILIAYRMPGERIGVKNVGPLGGNIAVEATKIYGESVVEPVQTTFENLINMVVLEGGLNCKYYSFKFNRLDTRDMKALTDRCIFILEHGGMTPNQMRKELAIGKPYDGGDKYYMKTGVIEVGEEEIQKKQNEFISAVKELSNSIKKVNEKKGVK